MPHIGPTTAPHLKLSPLHFLFAFFVLWTRLEEYNFLKTVDVSRRGCPQFNPNLYKKRSRILFESVQIMGKRLPAKLFVRPPIVCCGD